MKTTYTRKEMKRMMTIEATKILMENENAILTNTSYGGLGMSEVIGIESNDDSRIRWFVGLEHVRDEDKWCHDKYSFVIVKTQNDEELERKSFFTVWEMDSRNECLYVTDRKSYEKHNERCYAKWCNRQKEQKEMMISKHTELAKNIISRIEESIYKSIKAQDLRIVKTGEYYQVTYIYRNKEQTFSFRKARTADGKFYIRTI